MIKNTKKQKSKLELEIDSILDTMALLEVDAEEYAIAVEHLSTLYKLNGEQSAKQISADTKAIVAANLIGILLILKYEDLNVITSKAMGFVLRGRV